MIHSQIINDLHQISTSCRNLTVVTKDALTEQAVNKELV